jgi:transcriptional regulator with XRE-family HTH domain
VVDVFDYCRRPLTASRATLRALKVNTSSRTADVILCEAPTQMESYVSRVKYPALSLQMKRARELAGYRTQQDFAVAAGLPMSTLQKWERGIAAPSFEQLGKLLPALGGYGALLLCAAGLPPDSVIEMGDFLIVQARRNHAPSECCLLRERMTMDREPIEPFRVVSPRSTQSQQPNTVVTTRSPIRYDRIKAATSNTLCASKAETRGLHLALGEPQIADGGER